MRKLKIGLWVCLLLAIWFSMTKAGSVDLPWFEWYQDELASYWLDECNKQLPNEVGKYSCTNFILTLNAENGGWNKDAKPKNRNGTTDNGLCQLNSQYHSKFIKSDDFKDPHKQMDYCIGVRKDAKKKKVMPWYAYAVRHKRDKGIKFNTIIPPLSSNIAEPKIAKGTPIKKISKVCRDVSITVKKGEYLEVSYLGKLRMIIKNLWKWDTIKVCRDI